MRSAEIFQSESPPLARIFQNAVLLVDEHWSSTNLVSISTPGLWDSPLLGHNKPSSQPCTLNFDGSPHTDSNEAGFLIHDWQGRVLLAGAFSHFHCSVPLIELTIARLGRGASLNICHAQ